MRKTGGLRTRKKDALIEGGLMDYREAMQVLRAARLHAPAIVRHAGAYHVFSRTKLVSSGSSIYEALESGGLLVPDNAPTNIFAAHDFEVRQGPERVALAMSKTMAARIANALNEYIPGDRKK
jgi:hypothetical protein